MSRQSPCIARALPCPYDLHTSAGADFFVAAVASFRIHDRPFARVRAREDRHFKTAVVGSPLDVPIAGSLAAFEQECWFSLGFVHLDELTPPPAAPQLGIDEARLARCLWCRVRCGRLQLVEDRPQGPNTQRQREGICLDYPAQQAQPVRPVLRGLARAG